MRHSIKRISKSALSVILALMMVVSTMVVGTISSVNAATFVPNSKIYLDVSNKTYWTEAGYIYMYLYEGGTTEFVKMNKVDGESYIYEGTVNNANNKIIFLRNRDDIKDFKQWNQTVDIDNYDGTNNMFVLSSDDSTQKFKDVDGKENVAKQTGSWSTYGGSSGGGTSLGTAPIEVLNGTNVMFYIKAYYSNNDLGLSTKSKSPKKATKIGSSNEYAYISIAKTDLESYYYISNNLNNWEGKPNDGIRSAKGGELFVGNDNVSTTSATTGLTTLSSASANLGSTTPITLTTVSDKTISAYGSNLYVQYYVDKELVNTDADLAASTSGATYDLDVSGYSAGEHTIQTVLTDGNVYYIPDTDTFNVTSSSYAVTYGVSGENGTLEAKAGSDSIATGTSVTAGTKVTFTAKPNENYEVEGWYSDAGCTEANKISSAGTNTTYSEIVNSNTTVYVKFKSSTTGTANFHGGDVLYLNTGAWNSAGAFFAVKCINGSTSTWVKMVAVDGEDGLYKVTLPGVETVEYSDLKFGRMDTKYSSTAETDLNDNCAWNYQETTSVGYPTNGQNCLKVNAVDGSGNWNNDATWTTYSSKTPVDAPEIEVDNSGVIADTADASVTLTVKNYDTLITKYTDGLDFVLYKNGAAVANLTSSTYQIKEKGTYKVQAVPHNTTDYSESAFSNEVEVTKAVTGYEYSIIIQDITIAMTPSATESNVLYSNTTLGDGYWFKIARTKDGTTEYSNSKAGNSQAKDINAGANVKIDDWSADATSYNNAYKQNGGAAYYIKFNTATGVISLSSTTDGKVSINVYAKDGTTIKGGTKQLGETSVTAGASQILAQEDYIVYSAQADSYLTIQTKMDATAVTNKYYVYGFCINGIYYKADAKSGNIYETTYQVTGNEKNGIVEITPVYYNKNIEEANEYITVYADASQLGDHWGNTISCYSYYYKSANGTDAFETTPYPGQPMLLGTNGLYYTRVPRYYYSNGQKILDSNNNPYTISGVTLNSYTEGELHGTLYPEIGKNYQTYDYDDFKYIAELGYDTVKFVVQYRDDTESYQSKLLKGDKNAKDMSGSTLDINAYNSTHGGWNNLLNYDDEQIDLIGNVLTAEQKNNNSPLYVVSVGNQKTSMGEYSTVWYVYDSEGKYVTQGIPSDFITRKDSNNNKPAYNTIFNSENYKNHPVKISYESEMNASTSVNTGNSGVRIDGRWLYTKSTAQQIPVNLTVQYYNGSAWVTDETAIAGTAKIDDVSTENGVATKTFTERNVNAAISATAKSGYVFVEWGTVDENDTYTKLSNIKSASAEFMVDKSYNLVARFEKVEDGSLTISHGKYTGPGALGGGGYYKISADVVDASDAVITSYPISESPITISNLAGLKDSRYKIKITLTTTMKGENTFVDWFMLTPDEDYSNITQSADVWGSNDPVSQTITVDVADLYDENGANIVVSTLQYYSDIAPVTKDAILYYKYYNRFGKERTYTKVVSLSDEYIQTNINNGKDKYFITDKLIYENAPAVEDLHKNCTWTITEQKVTRQGTTATLWGTHSDLNHKVRFKTSENGSFTFKEVKDNDYLLDDSDEFFVANSKSADGNTNFAYWIVYDYNEYINNNQNLKEIAKCYSTKFNLRILGDYYIYPVYSNEKSQSLTISDPTFTREQYTDSTGNIKSDYLYADFIVAYMSSNGILLNGDRAQTMKYRTGLIVEFNKDQKIVQKDAPDAKFTGTLPTYTGFTDSEIEAFAKTGDSLKVSGNKAMYNFNIDNKDYNNKNRLDYYVKFPNTVNNKHYVFKAYYYVYYTNSEGNVVYDMTQPVYFTLFDIGNSSAVTTKTTA